MKIEFSFPHNEVPEHVIEFVKDKLIGYHRQYQEVSDADVVFRQLPEAGKDRFICQVIISLFGETLLVHRSAASYIQAARDVINEIEIRLEEVLKRINELPQQVITTIDV